MCFLRRWPTRPRWLGGGWAELGATDRWQALLLRCSGERPRLNLIFNLPRDSTWALDYSSAQLVCCTFTFIFDNCLVRDPSPTLRVSRLVLSDEENVSECGNRSHRFIRILVEINKIGWFELSRRQTFISVGDASDLSDYWTTRVTIGRPWRRLDREVFSVFLSLPTFR